VAVVAVAGGVAGFGSMAMVMVGNLAVDDNSFHSAVRARILLSTRLSNQIDWSSSSGVSRVTRACLSFSLNPLYHEVRLAASFQDTSAAYLLKSAK